MIYCDLMITVTNSQKIIVTKSLSTCLICIPNERWNFVQKFRLIFWSFILPFGIVDKLGLLTGPVVGILSWLMSGVYHLGHTIEDPFQCSLRLTYMRNSIYRDVIHGDRNQASMKEPSTKMARKSGNLSVMHLP